MEPALRLLILANHLGDLARVPGVHVQPGREEIAYGALTQGAEQGRFPGMAAADAADVNLRQVLPLPQDHLLMWQSLALLACFAGGGLLPRLSGSGREDG